MSDSPEPPPSHQSNGFKFGDLTSQRDINVTITDSAGRDKIENTTIFNIFKPSPDAAARLAQRNRQTMLAKVKAYWVDGVLAHSLHSKMIPLDMERNPGAVTRPQPWDMLWQQKNQPPQPLPPGTKTIDCFNYAVGEALLILGEPGSGKTTVLLELAEQLLAEAQANELLRIPVVFNLSSWAVTRPLLTEWLVSELQTLYLIPKKVAQTWVEQDDILPLLDGLDEVVQEHRPACIRAINDYRTHQGTPLIVCSRTTDYEAIGKKLLLSDALILRPLTPAQIDDYLTSGGRALDTVRHAIQQDNVLQDMAQSPLLLSIMALTYRDQPPEQFTTTKPDDRRRQLFATYIQRQLPQRQKDPHEDPATTLRQLTYLAYQMTTHDQTLFLIEHLQPTWFATPQQKFPYRLTVGKTLGLREIRPIEKIGWSWKRITQKGVVQSLFAGLVITLSLWFIGVAEYGLDFKRTGVLAVGLFSGLAFLLIDGFTVGEINLKVESNEGIKHSLHNAIRFGLVGGITGGLILGLFLDQEGNPFFRFSLGAILGSVIGLLYGGGIAVYQHYSLRLWLDHYHLLPFNLVPFLDVAADRLILQKVGGGYRFIHRTIQDYLATLYTPPPS